MEYLYFKVHVSQHDGLWSAEIAKIVTKTSEKLTSYSIYFMISYAFNLKS